jgi:CRP-like cAMP-binding protein
MMEPTTFADSNHDLDPKIFLGTVGTGRSVATFLKSQTIFTQGEAAGAVFYIQKGKVREALIKSSVRAASASNCM